MKSLRKTLLLLGAALALLLLGAACADEGAGPEEGADVGDITGEDEGLEEEEVADEELGAEEEVELGALVTDPAAFIDQPVTVSGSVSEVVNTTAFRLGGDDIGGEPLLVIGAEMAEVSPDEVVQVTGVVREYSEELLQEELGDAFDAEAFADFDDTHVIVASNVQPL